MDREFESVKDFLDDEKEQKVSLKKQIRESSSEQFILLTVNECGGGFSA